MGRFTANSERGGMSPPQRGLWVDSEREEQSGRQTRTSEAAASAPRVFVVAQAGWGRLLGEQVFWVGSTAASGRGTALLLPVVSVGVCTHERNGLKWHVHTCKCESGRDRVYCVQECVTRCV